MKRLENILFDEAYGDGDFPYLYMRMVTSFFSVPLIGSCFVMADFHMVIVRRTWQSIRLGQDKNHSCSRICLKILDEYVGFNQPRT